MTVKPEVDPDVEDEAPTSDGITPCDERHYVTYLRLLNAETDGADWTEVARIVLHRDPSRRKFARAVAGKVISPARNG